MDAMTEARIALQLIEEELDHLAYTHHSEIGSEYSDATIYTITKGANMLEIAQVYLRHMNSLFDGSVNEDQFSERLAQALSEVHEPVENFEPMQSLNNKLVTEILEEEIRSLKEKNAALQAQADLLEEIPFFKPNQKTA